MIISTAEKVDRREIVETLGIVSVVKPQGLVGKDKVLFKLWTDGMAELRQEFTIRAEAMHADAVIAVRIEMFAGFVYAYGTAVKLQ